MLEFRRGAFSAPGAVQSTLNESEKHLMSFSLGQHGYQFDAATRVWSRPGYQGIAYNDGDAIEQHIADIVTKAHDVSLISTELETQVTNWPTLYHLSGTRANILRPLKPQLQGRKVLEIGAGCGAITRYLGEIGAQLLALEGSPRRASIAASRSRDLSNVTVVAERFDDFSTTERFDVITLIGVLEYASMFTPGERPAVSMLERVGSMLAPGGILIVAIENQLGLKYFAGAAEDHVGQPMYGIEDRYLRQGARTFGKEAFAGLFVQAGFAATQFHASFPDYKFPAAIISEAGFAHREFDSATLAVQTVHQDPQLPAQTTFALQRVWPTVVANGLGMDMANSFLVVASVDGANLPAEHALAYYYNTARRLPFCKEILFSDRAGEVMVESKRIDNAGDASHALGRFRFNPEHTSPYEKGRLLVEDFIDLVSVRNWALSDVAAFIRRYIDVLGELLKAESVDVPLRSAYASLPGHYLDAIPQNLIIGQDGTPRAFDSEWQASESIELGFLLFRAILALINRNYSFSPESAAAHLSRGEFLLNVLQEVGVKLTPEDLERYVRDEIEFQSFATGRDAETFLQRWVDEPLPLVAPIVDHFTASVYYADADSAFSGQQLLTQNVGTGRTSLRFELPAQAGTPSMVRLDPTDRPGWYHLATCELFDELGAHRWSCRFDNDYVLSPSVIPLDFDTKVAGLLIYAVDNDPQMLLKLPAAVASRVGPGWMVRLEIERLCSADVARSWGRSFVNMVEQARAARAAGEQHARERLTQARAVTQLQEELARREARIAVLEAALAQHNHSMPEERAQ